METFGAADSKVASQVWVLCFAREIKRKQNRVLMMQYMKSSLFGLGSAE